MALSKSLRRIALVTVAVMGLTVALPSGLVPSGGGLPLAGLLRLFGVPPVWGAPSRVDPATPEQSRGGQVNQGHEVTSEATRADGDVGSRRGKGAGELDAYVAPREQDSTPERTRGQGTYDPATSRRDTRRSSGSMDYYDNADGSVTQIVSTGRTNFKDVKGDWVPIDTRLVERSGRGADRSEVRLETSANDVVVSVAGPVRRLSGYGRLDAAVDEVGVDVLGSWRELASVTLPSGEVFGYGLVGARPVLPTVNGSISRYRNVLSKTDVVLEATATGLKETLVLHAPAAGASWLFPLRLVGLTPSIDEAGAVLLANHAGVVVARIPAGQMWDSRFDARSGEFTTSTAVRYELVEVDGGPALRMTADEAWLRDPARQYPVYVDPTLTSLVTYDVFVDNLPSGPGHDGDNLPVGTFDGGSSKHRSFLRFEDLGTVFGKSITSVRLDLWHTWSYDCNHHLPVYANLVNGAWTTPGLVAGNYPGPALGAVVGEVTITDNYPACTNTGGNRSVGQWRTLWIDRSVVNSWLTGAIPNNGLALTASESDSDAFKRFTSRDHGDTYAPRLVVTWEENTRPQISQQYPAFGDTTSTLTPELLASGSDQDSLPLPLKYQFSLTDATGQTSLAVSSWLATPSWTVPSGVLEWGKMYLWTVKAFDGYLESTSQQVRMFMTEVRQPPITSRLSQNTEGPGYEPSIGNFTTSVVDAEVETVGPELAISRSYNSRDPRTAGAFGAGWSSVLDSKVTEYSNAASVVERVVVTYPSGEEAAFGRNPNGTFIPPQGRYATFVAVTGGYRLTDKDGTQLTFTKSLGGNRYAITSMKDAKGRELSFAYTGNEITLLTSVASGRTLTVSWAIPPGGTISRVALVSTNRAVAADANSVRTWQYSYSGGRLMSVCPPTSTTACTGYTYGSNSLYPSAVLDSRPHTYLRLGEASGATAAVNAAIDTLTPATGIYANVSLGQPGALPGSAATSAGFNGSSSRVTLTSGGLALAAAYQTVSMWFKTSTPMGVLFSYQQDPITNGTTVYNYTPSLYVGSSGRLYGEFWDGTTTSMASSGPVTDGQWHHVVLTSSGDEQWLFLDGEQIGSKSGLIQTLNLHSTSNIYVGTGFIGGVWSDQPNYSTTDFTAYARSFNGSISDFAFHDRRVSAEEIGLWHQSGVSASRPLQEITLPSGRTDRTVTYDTKSGVVDQITASRTTM